MSQLPEDLEGFFASFEGAWADGDAEGVVRHFNDDAEYHNVPMAPLDGIDAIREFVTGFLSAGTVTFEVHHQLVGDDVVMNERTDTIVMGDRVTPLPVMGTFEFRDGRIQRWRDYFDLAAFTG